MTPQRWQRVLEIAQQAFELAARDRREFLDRQCGDDPLLRSKVEAMLRADQRAEQFLSTSPFAEGLKREISDSQQPPGFTRSASGTETTQRGRFLPGTELGNRYRVVSVLGRGGMGEVVRADDLKLGEPVALKFLPELLTDNPPALAQLRQEVRLARRVSHPNVCRVHDIGEAEGLHFLSMEYVDGEDLGSLLRRIGRLPSDKGVELAQQLCAGLVAAHEQGVLHRDLKPANVMIDGRGRVRVTDFGVATLKEKAQTGDALVGTPAYLAPELLAGEPPSVASDLWALGLVLFETFTGRQAYTVDSPVGLADHATPLKRPSELVESLDGSVERIILRCLEKDSTRRPASALEVAAALPGGHPLAAAVAAGKTPSPEMVAASPDTVGLRPGLAAALLAIVLLGFGTEELMRERIATPGTVVAGKSPAVLLDRARDLVRELGYGQEPIGDLTYGLSYDPRHRLFWSDPAGPLDWQEEIGAPVYFWYHQRPRPPTLDPFGDRGRQESPFGPVAGTVRLRLDLDGNLRRFEAAPRHHSISAPGASTPTPAWEESAHTPTAESDPWVDVFTLASLDTAPFESAIPSRPPPIFTHQRAAWQTSNGRLTVEAAVIGDQPVYFEIFAPRSPVAETGETRGTPFVLARNLTMIVYIALLVASAMIARRNLRLDRSDRQGATRLGAVVFGLELMGWLLRFEHGLAIYPWGLHFVEAIGRALFITTSVGVYYLAFEPFVRRLWPQALVSWSRLIRGRLHDPLIGRDLLIGGVFGVFMLWLSGLGFMLSEWLGRGERVLSTVNLDAMLGTPQVFAQLFLLIRIALYITFIHMFFLLLLRFLIRHPMILATAFTTLQTVMIYSWFVHFFNHAEPTDWLFTLLIACCVTILIMRFGLLATFAANMMLLVPSMFPVVTTHLSSWSATGTVVVTLAISGLMLFAYITAVGRPLLREPVRESLHSPD